MCYLVLVAQRFETGYINEPYKCMHVGGITLRDIIDVCMYGGYIKGHYRCMYVCTGVTLMDTIDVCMYGGISDIADGIVSVIVSLYWSH